MNSVTSDNVKNYIKSMWGREEVPNDDNDDDDDMMMMILTDVWKMFEECTSCF